MNIARIAYANTDPFFHYWNASPFGLQRGAPRALAEEAREGNIVAGPLPIVECWGLEPVFQPLGSWGIAAREKSRSVFVFSKRPFNELGGGTLAVTTESSTSVILADVLLRARHNQDVVIRRGFSDSDEARLVIGDAALRMGLGHGADGWTHVTDLATEWWAWTSLPFVFARWVVRADLSPFLQGKLSGQVEASFAHGMVGLETVAQAAAQRLGLPLSALLDYYRGFLYELGPEAEESIQAFRRLSESLIPVAG